MDKVQELISENGIIIFSKSTCCLCYSVQMLFEEQLRVHPRVYEIDHDPANQGKEIEKTLMRMGCNGGVPAVFIGGKLVGSINDVMSLHLRGSLIPLLRPYRA